MSWINGAGFVECNDESGPLVSYLEMFEKWRDPMFIDTAYHHYRLQLEIDAFAGAASSRDSSSKSAHESTEIAAGSRSYE